MPPRRPGRTVVRTRKRVVEESVEVSVLDDKEEVPIISETGVSTESDRVTEVPVEDEEEKRAAPVEILVQGEEERAPPVEILVQGEEERALPVEILVHDASTGKDGVLDDKTGIQDEETPHPSPSPPPKEVGCGSAEEEATPPAPEIVDLGGQRKVAEKKGMREDEDAPSVMKDRQTRARRSLKVDRAEGSKKKGRKRRKRRGTGKVTGGGLGAETGYKRYVFKVLKQVHPELGVSSPAMQVIDALMKDMFDRIVDEAAKLSLYGGKVTLSPREIQGAVRLVLPGELGKHAVAEGSKAVAKYMDATGRERHPSS